MTKQFAVIRIYREDKEHYSKMAELIQDDIFKTTGRKINVSLPMVFKAITPQFNKNLIEINLSQFKKAFEGRRRGRR